MFFKEHTSRIKETNNNGNLLLDLTIENEMIPPNLQFPMKVSKLWTFTYPNQSQAQIDYILINKKWIKSATTLLLKSAQTTEL